MGLPGVTATSRRKRLVRGVHRGRPGTGLAPGHVLQRDALGRRPPADGVRRPRPFEASGGPETVARTAEGRAVARELGRLVATEPAGVPRRRADARDRARVRGDARGRARPRDDPVLRPEPRRRHVPVLCRGPSPPVRARAVDDDRDDRVHGRGRGHGGARGRNRARRRPSRSRAPAEVHLGSIALCDIRAVVEGHRAAIRCGTARSRCSTSCTTSCCRSRAGSAGRRNRITWRCATPGTS